MKDLELIGLVTILVVGLIILYFVLRHKRRK